MKRALSCAAAGLCLALALFFLLPLCAGILHFGMLWPAAALLGAAAVCCGRTFPASAAPQMAAADHRLRGGDLPCGGAGNAGQMVQSAGHRPTDDAPCTVVVLGCQVYPDGHPSLMLQIAFTPPTTT